MPPLALDSAGLPEARLRGDAGTVHRRRGIGAAYRVDPSGRVDLLATKACCPIQWPRLLTGSEKLYVVSFAKFPGDTGRGGDRSVYGFDIGANNRLSAPKLSAIS